MADTNAKRRLRHWLKGKDFSSNVRLSVELMSTEPWNWTPESLARFFNVTPKLLTKILNYEA